MRNRGFTLIELMVVIAMIGIIAAFAAPVFKIVVVVIVMICIIAAFAAPVFKIFNRSQTTTVVGVPEATQYVSAPTAASATETALKCDGGFLTKNGSVVTENGNAVRC